MLAKKDLRRKEMMKPLLSVIAAVAACSILSADDGFEPIFNGENLDGWNSIREQTAEGSGGFSVDQKEAAIHVYAGKEAGSTQDIDCLYSDKEYGSYVLKLEYKWLDKRFAPRVNHDRDAGLLFHVHGDLTKMWPACLEMQMGESDSQKTDKRYTTGDLWVIGKDLEVVNEMEGELFYSPGGIPTSVGKDKAYDKSYTPYQNENAHGEWNEMTLTVHAGSEAIYELNGKVVNRITDMTNVVDGVRVPLVKGRIGIQAEYAELMYRNIRIKEL